MYAFLTGTVEEIGVDRVELDCHGVGYEIFTNTAAVGQLKKGAEARFYTTLIVREDSLSLFGFLSREEKAMFDRLITVSGVGPRLAVAALSGMTAPEIAVAIVTGDERALARISGIGKKTAQRLILELRASLENADIGIPADFAVSGDDTVSQAVAALVAMGFAPSESAAAVAIVKAEGGTSEQMAVNALKRLDRGK